MKFLKFLKFMMGNEQGILGLFGSSKPTSFTLPDKELRDKINKMQAFGESEITGPSRAGELTLEDLERQRQDVFNKQAQMQQRDLSGQLSNMALFGGRGGGAGERLARQSGIQGELTRQGLFGDFAGMRTQALASDLANEQQRRDTALARSLGAESSLLGARTSAQLANIGAAAQRKASRSGLFGSLGSLAGLGLAASLAPATGGASLAAGSTLTPALYAGAGGLFGSMLGGL